MNGLSLFSGCGGLDLALMRVIPNAETIMFCEIEEYPARILQKRFPWIPIWRDVYTLDGRMFSEEGIEVHFISAGFPCQSFSIAGKTGGVDDSRGILFWEITRIAREIQEGQGYLPALFLENVSNLYAVDNGSTYGDMLGSLAEMGFSIAWGSVYASWTGALHARERIFIFADSEDNRLEYPIYGEGESGNEKLGGQTQIQFERIPASDEEWFREQVCSSEFVRTANGSPLRMDRIIACGNGVVPQQADLGFKILMRSLNGGY